MITTAIEFCVERIFFFQNWGKRETFSDKEEGWENLS